MNPHKWKKYSLEDADISDRSNTSAAFAFLKEIENRKDNDDCNDGTETSSSSSKIVFNRSRNNPKYQRSAQLQRIIETNDDDEMKKSAFKSSKVVMPEYNFGQTKKAPKLTTKKSKEDSKERKIEKSLHLDHLMADDEDQEYDKD